MTDVSRDVARRRPWWAHVVVGLFVGVAALGVVLAVYTAMFIDAEACPGYDDEGTMAAPVSPKGQLLCGDDLLSSGYVAVVLGLGVVLLVVALWQWWRRHVRWFLVAVVLAPLLPMGIGIASLALPEACTDQQWAKHGAEGCERDREAR